jgi:N-acetylglucosamine-6-sulfatase
MAFFITRRRAAVAALAPLALAALAHGASAQPAPERRPNIVFVLTDDLAWNLVQYMPHVLQMQRDGVTFSNYFTTDSLCCPSRASILTGAYPHSTGIFTNVPPDGGFAEFNRRHLERSTFAISLQAAGYRTALLGKYLNSYEPKKHPPEPGWSVWAVGGNEYEGFDYDLNEDGKAVHYGTEPADYQTDVLANMAVRFIKESAGKPFLIEVATYSPHEPSTPAPRDANAFPGLRAPRTPAFNAPHDATQPEWLRLNHDEPRAALTEANIAEIDAEFRKRAQSVLSIDAMIGRLQAAVAEIGQSDNTYFFFNSDNGYHMGEFGLMPQKMTAYDTDIRVPLIVTGPGIAAGRKIDEFALNIDLSPTFTELGGAETHALVDGRSLVGLLHGRPPVRWRNLALVEHHGPVTVRSDPDFDIRGNPPDYAAIRGPAFLYVEYINGDREYHDLGSDPHQVRNTYASLSEGRKASLHAALVSLGNCRGTKACSVADLAVTEKR